MKYRYYITDTYDGCVKGTDDEEVATGFAESEDYFVVDAERGEWLTSNGERTPVPEA